MKNIFFGLKYFRLAFLIFASSSSSQPTKEIVKVTTIMSPGFIELNSDGTFFGFIPDLLTEIEKQSNYSFPLQNFGDNKPVVAKTYAELIPNIKSNKADIIAADFRVSSVRYTQIDYSVEILDIGTVLVVKTPTNVVAISQGASYFLRPFSFGTWMSVFGVFLLSAALIFVNSKLNPRETKFNSAKNSTQETHVTIASAIFYVCSSCLFQGNYQRPRSISGKLIFVNIWIFGLIFVLTYASALLVAILSSPGLTLEPLLVTNLKEAAAMARVDKIRPLFLPNSSTENLMKNSRRPEIRDLYEAYQRRRDFNRNFTTVDNIFDSLNYATDTLAIVESTQAHLKAKSTRCKVTTLPDEEFLFESSLAFAFRHDGDQRVNHLRRTVNEIVTKLRSTGRIEEIYDYHFRSKVNCLGTSTQIGRITSKAAMKITKTFSESLPITINLFIGPLIVYFIGVLVSVFGACLDVFIFAQYERL